MAARPVAIHRCRFVEQTPHAVESLEFEPEGSRLAVLRANADIELWRMVEGQVHCEAKIAGMIDAPVRRLAWSARSDRHPAGRLFSCGLHGLVTEWDPRSLSAVRSFDSVGGAAWSMALHHGSGRLAVGCEDGGCSLFDVHSEEMELCHRTPPLGARLLCVAFDPRGSHLACASADGSVRVWHTASWQAVSQMVLESQGKKKPPLIWSVLLLSGLCVVTGDSSGHVSYFDGRHGTLVGRFASHQADVLCLAASADETAVFASGVDQKVALFCPQPTEPSSSSTEGRAAPRAWALTCSRRPHTHDVRALATAQLRRPSGDSVPVLVSGGIDTQLAILRTDLFERSPPIKCLPLPHLGSLSSAVGPSTPAPRVLCHDGLEVSLWQLPSFTAGAVPASEDPSASPTKLLLLRPQLKQRNVAATSLSPCGEWIAVSDSVTRLFRLRDAAADRPAEALLRLSAPAETLPACCSVFSPDSRLLFLGTVAGLVQALTIEADGRSISPTVHTMRGRPTEADSVAAIVRIAVSHDAQWLASSDTQGKVALYSIDTMSYRTSLPALSAPPTALAFMPRSELLVVATASKQLVVFDAAKGELAEWTLRNSAPIAEISASAEVPLRLSFNPAHPETVVLSAQSWLCSVRLSLEEAAADAPDASLAKDAAKPPRGKKRLRGREKRKAKLAEAAGLEMNGKTSPVLHGNRLVSNYGPMLHFDFMAPDTALVVEQPWLRVMQKFPPALFRQRFGT
ncbi:hypothetical protein AB1Y20_020380 [Prymnesium parvum]|uniref:WD repeat-containing protein 55 homolog n=1 Tax=Prymnesium parvum TaxID=97485 RepID=A0AB34JTG4_PRYPA